MAEPTIGGRKGGAQGGRRRITFEKDVANKRRAQVSYTSVKHKCYEVKRTSSRSNERSLSDARFVGCVLLAASGFLGEPENIENI